MKRRALLPYFAMSLSVISFATTPEISKRVEAVRLAVPEAADLLGNKGIETVINIVDQTAGSRADSTSVVQGRLTLTSLTPANYSDVTAATTVYYTPYTGNKIALYSGTVWQLLSFSETSVAVPATTGTNFDIFAYNNNGTLALETANWSTDTARATALTRQDGVLCKSGALTRRYLGTGRTTAVSGQTESSDTKRYLWNYYNQLDMRLYKIDSTDHSYSVSTSNRQFNGNSANKVELVVGQTQLVTATLWQNSQSSAGTIHCQGIVGYDSLNSPVSELGVGGINTGAQYANVIFPYHVGDGYHYFTMSYWVSGAFCTFWASSIMVTSAN